MRHTESDDVNRLIVGIPAFILLCLLIAGLWNSVHAAPSNGYRVSSTWGIGNDSSWVADSAILYVFKDFADDTARRVFPLYPPDTIHNHPKEADSVARIRTGIWAPTTWVVGGYNPSFFVIWFLHQANDTTVRREEYDDSPRWTVQIVSTDSAETVDTLLKGVSATATVNWTVGADTIDQVLTAAHGAGSWQTGAGVGGTGQHAVQIFVTDTVNDVSIDGVETYVFQSDGVTQEGYGVTNPGGFFTFQLDTGTYFVRADVIGYFQEYYNDTVVVSGPMQDTCELYPYVVTIPTSADSTTLVIFTDVPYARAKISLKALARENEGKPIRDASGYWIDRNEIRPNPTADSNGTFQLVVARTAVTTPKSGYDIVITNKFNDVFFKIEKFVTDSNADTISTVP